MSKKRGQPVARPPIGILFCRGCCAEIGADTVRWDHEQRTMVCTCCGTTDPANADDRLRRAASMTPPAPGSGSEGAG